MGREPIRSCLACRGRNPKRKLLRVVLEAGLVETDPAQDKPGRGAYLHQTPACLNDKRVLQKLPHALRLVEKGSGVGGGLKLGESMLKLLKGDEAGLVTTKPGRPKLRF